MTLVDFAHRCITDLGCQGITAISHSVPMYPSPPACLFRAEHRVSVQYSIDQRCGTKAELPDLTPDEYDAIAEADRLNPGGIEQVGNAVGRWVTP